MLGIYTAEPPDRVVRRLAAHVEHVGDCIVSRYSKNAAGYAQIGWYGNGERCMRLAHRIAWAALRGPIPAGMTVDHLCRNRACINIDHLRLLTVSENTSDTSWKHRTHCPLGHPYDEANTYVNRNGHRQCRECSRTRWK